MRYLLDTNVLSEPLLRQPDGRILRNLEEHRDELATASIVLHEMLFGCRRLPPSATRAAIQKYLDEVVRSSVPILPYDAGAARWHADERARLTGIGRTPPFADGQIAAVAKTNNLVLVTSNVSDYEGFESLRVEDWRTA